MDRVEGKEEVLGDGTSLLELDEAPPIAGQATDSTDAKPPFSFSYLVGEKKVFVPAFKWKKKDGPETLNQYAEKLKEILNLLEKRQK